MSVSLTEEALNPFTSLPLFIGCLQSLVLIFQRNAYVRSRAQRAPALSNRLMSGCSRGRRLEGKATPHAFASYLLVSDSINFYAFIVFN